MSGLNNCDVRFGVSRRRHCPNLAAKLALAYACRMVTGLAQHHFELFFVCKALNLFSRKCSINHFLLLIIVIINIIILFKLTSINQYAVEV